MNYASLCCVCLTWDVVPGSMTSRFVAAQVLQRAENDRVTCDLIVCMICSGHTASDVALKLKTGVEVTPFYGIRWRASKEMVQRHRTHIASAGGILEVICAQFLSLNGSDATEPVSSGAPSESPSPSERTGGDSA